jgi:hypothetical protein
MNNKDIIAVHNHYADFREQLENKRNETLEEVAREIEKMKAFEKDTMASFAVFVRGMKK